MKRSQSGVGFVEVIVAMVIGLFLVGGLFLYFGGHLKRTDERLVFDQFAASVRGATGLMESEFQRAGYWGGAKAVFLTGSAFANPFAPVDVPNPDCISYAYDRNGNGLIEPEERHGFMLSGGVIYYKERAEAEAAPCSLTASAAGWSPVTDPRTVTVTGLTFTKDEIVYPVGDGTVTVTARTVAFLVAGNVKDRAGIAASTSGIAYVRNDLVQKVTP